MGKTKTALVGGTTDEELSGAEKYKLKQQKKAAKEAKEKKKTRAPGLRGGERVAVVGADLPSEESTDKETEAQEAKKRGQPKLRGKKYKAALAKVDKTKLYALKDAVKLVKETSISKFDGTVELHLVVKKQGLSASVELPHSTGKSKKIEVADEKTLKKLKTGKIDFDVLLATPDMMPKLVSFAKILGPKGLMPNPKTGTLIKDVKEAKKFSANKITLKTERKAPTIHISVGKVSQKSAELEENIEAILKAVGKRQINKAVITSTMGPGIKLEI